VSSGYIPPKDEPGPEEIVEALREAVFENPRLREMPAEEEGFEADELSEEGNPT
jgi:hypothetical protein